MPSRRRKYFGGSAWMPCTRKAPASRNGTGTTTSNCDPRVALVCGITPINARSLSAKGTLIISAGLTFCATPKSTCQTSPRSGTAAFLLFVQSTERGSRQRCKVFVGQILRHRNVFGNSEAKFPLFGSGQFCRLMQQVSDSLRHAGNLSGSTCLIKSSRAYRSTWVAN